MNKYYLVFRLCGDFFLPPTKGLRYHHDIGFHLKIKIKKKKINRLDFKIGRCLLARKKRKRKKELVSVVAGTKSVSCFPSFFSPVQQWLLNPDVQQRADLKASGCHFSSNKHPTSWLWNIRNNVQWETFGVCSTTFMIHPFDDLFKSWIYIFVSPIRKQILVCEAETGFPPLL